MPSSFIHFSIQLPQRTQQVFVARLLSLYGTKRDSRQSWISFRMDSSLSSQDSEGTSSISTEELTPWVDSGTSYDGLRAAYFQLAALRGKAPPHHQRTAPQSQPHPNTSMEDVEVQVPQSIAEAEELVKRLYQPGPPPLTHRLQEELQKLQQSTEGWRLADILLGSDDNNVRFFGALTFYVKVNSAWESLTEDDASFLLDRLIAWLITSVSRDDPGSVVRKMCSTLALLFLRRADAWTDYCLSHLIGCLHAGKIVPTDSLPHSPSASDTVPRLSHKQLLAAVYFATSLAEERQKLPRNPQNE